LKTFTLTKKHIVQIVDHSEIIKAIEKAFADHAEGNAVIPPVVNLDIEENNGEVHIKSCHIREYDHYCIKIASGFYENSKLGLPTGYGMMLLFSSRTGMPSALILDEGLLTDLRTAAAGAVAARYLAKKGALNVCVIGAGVQARLQVEFLAKVLQIHRVNVWGVNDDETAHYIDDMGPVLPGHVITAAKTPSEAAEGADIIITATPSRKPLISADDLRPGMHITAMGSDGPDKQEVDTRAFERIDKIVVDHRGQCSRLGELHHALEQNIVTPESVYAELGEIVTNRLPGRENDDEITLCDLTGVGVQDIAIANWALMQAQAKKLGSEIEI